MSKNAFGRRIFTLMCMIVFVLLLGICTIGDDLGTYIQSEDVLTLSPEMLGENYKSLKGYRVHTVVWLDHYTLGSPYGQARENNDKYEYDLSLKEKPEKGNYIEIEATVGSAFLGYIDLNDAEIISIGEQAVSALERIDEEELTDVPDIDLFKTEVDQKQEEESNKTAEEETEQFKKNIEDAKREFESNNDIISLTPEQLKDRHGELERMRFHTVLTVNGIHKDYFTAKLNQSDWTDSFYCYFDWSYDLRDYLEKGEIVEIVGTVKPGFWSSSDYTSCQLLSRGDEAQKTLDLILESEMTPVVSDDSNLRKETEIIQPLDEVAERASEEVSPAEQPESSPVVQVEEAVETQSFSESYESEYISLSKGDSGEDVKEIQQKLVVLGYLSSSVDGKFGPGTEQAVKDFQNSNQLEGSGIIDQKTYDVMFSADAMEKAFDEIKKGDSGDSVLEVQKRLIALGYLASAADGKFGPGTEQAVIAFQKGNQLSATGVIDESAYNVLMSDQARKNTVSLLQSDSSDNALSASTRGTGEAYVWIPTNGGKKYHSKSTCSNMRDPRQVSISEAQALGFTPCGRCY